MKDNNILIAEFMGYEVKHNKCYSPKYNDGTIAPMQFDTSWDWLMPVIAKIVKDYGEGWSFEEGYDLEVRYQSVVNFIKEYNNGK
jgi:hypothetical protein